MPSAIQPLKDVVSELMRSPVVTLGPGESVLEADRIMRLGRIRHVPITQDERLIGIVSHRDVLEASIARLEEVTPAQRIDHLRHITLSQILKGTPRTIAPDCPIRDAALLMLRLKIGCLPVVVETPEGPRLVGLVTETDLIRHAYAPDFLGGSD